MHLRKTRGTFSKLPIGASWSQTEQALRINILKLKAKNFAILTFCRYTKDVAVHMKMENQTALVYLLKIRGIKDLLIIQEAKETWTETDEASREMKNSSSKWVLNRLLSKKFMQVVG